MKKKILSSFLSIVVILGLILFTPPMLHSNLEEIETTCSSIAVGRLATKDKSVLFGHNEDDSGNVVTRLHIVPRIKHGPGEVIEMWDIVLPDGSKGTIPQIVGETWAYIWSEMPGFSFSDSYINEWGVAIASDACSSRERPPYDLTNGGIKYWLRRVVAERAKTAREGVKIIGEMVEKYGYASSGRTYIIADPNEAWLCSVVAGRHWVAQRVPDDEVAFIPNRYTIREVNLNDTKNFLGSPDLIEYAISKGWYDPSSGEPFDFAKAYGGVTKMDIRQWGALRLITGIEYSMDEMAPFSIKPNRKFTVKDVIGVLRAHYESTDYDQTKVGTKGDPHHTSTRVICTASTQESFVMQLRNNMPSIIGNIYWRAQGRPCEGVFVPFYLGILDIPVPYAIGEPSRYDKLPLETRYYDPDSAYWVFNRLNTLVDMDYLVRKPYIRSIWDDFEAREFALQGEIEKTALKIYHGKDYHGILGGEEYLARWFLTRYTEAMALNAYYTALGFIEEFEQ